MLHTFRNRLAPVLSVIHNMFRIGNMVRKAEPVYFYVGSLLTALTVVIPFVTAWLSAVFINTLVHGGFHSVFDPELLWIAIGYIMLPFINGQLNTAYAHIYNQFYVRFGQYRDLIVLDKRAEIDLQTYEDGEFNNLVTKVNENGFRILNFMNQIMNLFSSSISAGIAALVVANYSPLMALALFLGLLPQLIIQLRFGRRTWGIWTARTDLRRKYSEYQRPFLLTPGLIEVRVFETKKYFMRAITDVISLFNGELRETERKRFVMQMGASILNFFVGGICIFVLMRDTVAGIIALGTFTFLVGRVGDLRTNISGFISSFAAQMTDNLFITDFFSFLDTPRTLKDGTRDAPQKTPIIVFDNVSFAYPKQEKLVLHDISFTISPGEKVAIVGVNGAGKTTLTKLLMRFYDPTSGTVTVSDTPLSNLTLASWYSHIGYLPQDYAKYRLPVKEAIAIGDPSVPMQEWRVIDAAKRSGADEFITGWKNGYDTPLGRDFDGEEPSVGQWQKLALARVFYKNPNIWVLDEPTSSIDAVAELEVFNELEHLPKDKTVILISHRFNTVKNADKIIVLEYGTIKEMGTHNELMKLGGSYARLFTSQKDSFGG